MLFECLFGRSVKLFCCFFSLLYMVWHVCVCMAGFFAGQFMYIQFIGNQNDYAVFRWPVHRCIWWCQYQYFPIEKNQCGEQKSNVTVSVCVCMVSFFFGIICEKNWPRWTHRSLLHSLLTSNNTTQYLGNFEEKYTRKKKNSFGCFENNANDLHWIALTL